MLRRTLILLLFVTSGAVSSPPVHAQELTTDAERSWRELRSSKDVKRKLLAERWNNVTRQQEWSDTTGKFKTSAKYVEHDPQLAWVKLRVIQGTGSQRVVKDVQIPLEKLSKSCQSRVRQIATLSEKIAAAIEEEKKAAEEDKDGAAGERGGMMEEGRGAGEELDGGMAGMDAAGPAGAGPTGESRGEVLPEYGRSETVSEPPVTNNGPPLPAVIPRVPGSQSDLAATEQPVPPPESAGENIALAGDESWRTSYEAFCANITPPNRSQPAIGWGVIQPLAAAHDTWSRYGSDAGLDEAAKAEIKQGLAAAGEVTWEATLIATGDETGDWTSALNLTPLPEPVTIRFILDPEQDPGPWQDCKAEERVQFVGRFFEFHDANGITVAIRLVASPGSIAREPQ